jgi:ribose/xylose/arabinose/galactoside ABC-type transport system permease subunit
MPSVLLQLLPVAIAAALTPTAVLAVILILFSRKARRNGAAFLAGWYLGLLILSWVIVALLARLGFFSSLLGGYSLSAGFLVVLGLLLLLVALQQWRTRPRAETAVAAPAWFNRLDTLSPGHSFGIGAALASITPKMILLTLAAAVIVGQIASTPFDRVLADLFYATLASLPVAIPVALFFSRGERARVTFLRWRDWLLRNNNALMAAVSLLMGLALVAAGLAKG